MNLQIDENGNVFHGYISSEKFRETDIEIEEDIEIFDSYGKPKYKYEGGLIELTQEQSYPLENYKKDKITALKSEANEKIIAVYPLWKQINIRALDGYTEERRSSMIEFINSIRGQVTAIENNINLACSHEELDAVNCVL